MRAFVEEDAGVEAVEGSTVRAHDVPRVVNHLVYLWVPVEVRVALDEPTKQPEVTILGRRRPLHACMAPQATASCRSRGKRQVLS